MNKSCAVIRQQGVRMAPREAIRESIHLELEWHPERP